MQRDDGHVFGVVAREFEVGEAQLDRALFDGQVVRHLGEGLHERAHGAVGERLYDVVFVVEVLVEGAGAKAGAARDLAQRQVGRAPFEQHLASRHQDLVAGLAVAPLAAASEALGAETLAQLRAVTSPRARCCSLLTWCSPFMAVPACLASVARGVL